MTRLLLLAVIATLFRFACGCAATGPSQLDVATYASEQSQCVAGAETRAEADKCRAASKAAFCAKWPTVESCK